MYNKLCKSAKRKKLKDIAGDMKRQSVKQETKCLINICAPLHS